ncbi:MAG: EthD family reductase [Acidimicrobiia bacterium]|nr:EthD family reductase [Acidimicrobiia bacterium]
MAVLRVCYKSGVRFDEAYYMSKHLPLAGGIMGPHGVTSIEVVRLGPNPDGSQPPYQVMFTAHFTSTTALQSAMADPRMPQILGDIPNYHDGMPDLMVGELVALPPPA